MEQEEVTIMVHEEVGEEAEAEAATWEEGMAWEEKEVVAREEEEKRSNCALTFCSDSVLLFC